MIPQKSSSGAQKRILWEVRKRHNIQPHRATATTRADAGISRQLITPRNPVLTTKQTIAAKPVSGGGSPPHNNFPVTSRKAHPPRRHRNSHWLRRSLIFIILLAVIGSGIFGYKILAAGNKITTAERSIIGQLKDLLFNDGKHLAGETEGRINVLLLAVGGEGHQGENLADTIMLASFAPANQQVALLSIPRDLYVQVPDEDYFSKINAVHAYGETKKDGRGPIVLEELVTKITGQPIHYYARIDFTAFKQIIDAVGGVDIDISHSFFDYWHKIDFRAGREHMDGERSLAYVRARYVEGSEGGDFKRAARQQQVLLALRENIFSVDTALDFSALTNILDSVSANVRTDLQLWEMKRMYELARAIDHQAVGSAVLSTGPNGVLVGTTEILGGAPASVLRPRIGINDYSEIQAIAANLLNIAPTTIASTSTPTPEPKPVEEVATPITKPTVEIRNGTTITGLASSMQTKLTADGYEVISIGNAATRNNTKTTVYAIKDDSTDAAKVIAENLNATTDSDLPETESATEAAILIILGSDTAAE